LCAGLLFDHHKDAHQLTAMPQREATMAAFAKSWRRK
jgi:hypothetical protein